MKGFAHSYCKKKVRENYFKIPVVTHNLLRIHFFFSTESLRAGVWRQM